jgi:hypothetical protein
MKFLLRFFLSSKQESLEAAAKIQELNKKLSKAKELVRRLPGNRIFFNNFTICSVQYGTGMLT